MGRFKPVFSKTGSMHSGEWLYSLSMSFFRFIVAPQEMLLRSQTAQQQSCSPTALSPNVSVSPRVCSCPVWFHWLFDTVSLQRPWHHLHSRQPCVPNLHQRQDGALSGPLSTSLYHQGFWSKPLWQLCPFLGRLRCRSNSPTTLRSRITRSFPILDMSYMSGVKVAELIWVHFSAISIFLIRVLVVLSRLSQKIKTN